MRTPGWKNSGEASMPEVAQRVGVLCDTGFLIRLGQPDDPLHADGRGYPQMLDAGGNLR